MRIARIKDSYMFDKNSKGSHWYVLYYDRPSSSYRAVELTHLYSPDKKRFDKVKKNTLMKMKFSKFETPSGVDNSYYSTDINNKKINVNSKSILTISNKHLPKSQSSKIIQFAKNKRR